MYSLMSAIIALLVLSGCDGTMGKPSDSVLVEAEIAVPDAGTSTVVANPTLVTADGTATSTITVTVNDASYNPVMDANVILAQTGTSTISTVTNLGDGTYTFDVNSTTSGTVTYTATADGVTITHTADVTFTALTEEECLLAAGGYETIVMNGRTWLDRNLGASEAAANVNDAAAFGGLYQWGRSTDGHQERTSETNDTLATTLDGDNTNTDWYGKFIVSQVDGDWVETGIDDDGSLRSQSWSAPYDETANPNQVCPCGYIVPTVQDFRDLNLITDTNAADTFNLAYTGYKRAENGNIIDPNNSTAFWTTEVENSLSANAYYNSSNYESYVTNGRGDGFSIRCIKPE